MDDKCWIAYSATDPQAGVNPEAVFTDEATAKAYCDRVNASAEWWQKLEYDEFPLNPVAPPADQGVMPGG